jgi:ADP-heptose:LPS heptosyltransferase
MPNLKSRLLVDYYCGGVLHAMLKPFVMVLGVLLRRNHQLNRCAEVTYLKLLGGGSLIMAYPSLLAMKQNPGIRKLRLLATKSTAPFGQLLGVFDEVIIIRDDRVVTLLWDSLRAIWRLFRTDAIVDLEVHSRLSTVLAVLTMARNRVGAYTGESFWRQGLSTHLIFYNQHAPIYLLSDQIAGFFGGAVPAFAMCIEQFKAHMARVESPWTGALETDIALSPCCSDLGRERMLRDEDWTTVLREALQTESAQRVHLMGAPGDRRYLEKLVARLEEAFQDLEFVIHAGNMTLPQSVALLGKVSRLLCIDSSLLHFARLQGVSTTSYWGPTDPATRLRPSTVSLDVVKYDQIACSPCVHVSNTAPCHGNNICMRFAVDRHCGLDRNPIWLAKPESPGKPYCDLGRNSTNRNDGNA